MEEVSTEFIGRAKLRTAGLTANGMTWQDMYGLFFSFKSDTDASIEWARAKHTGSVANATMVHDAGVGYYEAIALCLKHGIQFMAYFAWCRSFDRGIVPSWNGTRMNINVRSPHVCLWFKERPVPDVNITFDGILTLTDAKDAGDSRFGLPMTIGLQVTYETSSLHVVHQELAFLLARPQSFTYVVTLDLQLDTWAHRAFLVFERTHRESMRIVYVDCLGSEPTLQLGVNRSCKVALARPSQQGDGETIVYESDWLTGSLPSKMRGTLLKLQGQHQTLAFMTLLMFNYQDRQPQTLYNSANTDAVKACQTHVFPAIESLLPGEGGASADAGGASADAGAGVGARVDAGAGGGARVDAGAGFSSPRRRTSTVVLASPGIEKPTMYFDEHTQQEYYMKGLELLNNKANFVMRATTTDVSPATRSMPHWTTYGQFSWTKQSMHGYSDFAPPAGMCMLASTELLVLYLMGDRDGVFVDPAHHSAHRNAYQHALRVGLLYRALLWYHRVYLQSRGSTAAAAASDTAAAAASDTAEETSPPLEDVQLAHIAVDAAIWNAGATEQHATYMAHRTYASPLKLSFGQLPVPVQPADAQQHSPGKSPAKKKQRRVPPLDLGKQLHPFMQRLTLRF